MYAIQRDDMKIFVAAEVAADSATSTGGGATTTSGVLPMQQQREFRSKVTAVSSPGSNLKYNGKYSSKTSNMLRQVPSYHSSITSINGLNEAANNTKSQQQQQQPQMLYTNHSHSLARKKYFGSNSNLQQQHQSSYLNNNNLLMKNQNIMQQQMSDCKLSDGNNNNVNNSQKTSSKWLSSSKKRSSPSTSIESTSSYYRSSPDSSTDTSSTAAATSVCSNSSSNSPTENAEIEETARVKQQPAAAGAGESLKAARPPRQQPLSFWKTNYPQQPTNQMKNQVGMTVASQKEALAVEQQQQNQQQQQQQQQQQHQLQALSYEQRRNSGATYQQHQQNYYQYYYPQPKQLTIASFLQKELLPEAHISSSNSNSSEKTSSNSNSFGRHQTTGAAASGGYQQQRYRNAQCVYQHYQQQHAQQQQQTPQQQQQQQHFRRKHSDNHGNSNSKKMHYSPEGIIGPQKSIEILPISNFNSMHRRAQGGNGGKSGYYQHHYHAVIEGGGAAATPTSSEHQNLYNLTYVNVDADACSEGVTEAAGSKAALTATTTTPVGSPAVGKLSLLAKPSITLTTATSSPALGTSAPVAIPVAIPVAGNMFVPPPPLPLALLSPVASSGHSHSPGTTPANMISCAQLDEAITAAAASGTADTGEQQQRQAPSNSPNNFPSGVPFLIQQQQQQPPHSLKGPQQPQQQLFFHFGEAYAQPAPQPPPPAGVWPHPSSPCYPTTVSPHSVPGHRSISPALSSNSSSHGSESHWSGNSNNSRLAGPARSPLNGGGAGVHHTHMHGHPHGLAAAAAAAYGPLPHRGASPIANSVPWYDVILPPDRYLTQARNMELTVQPEKLICMSKYDKLSLQMWNRFRGAQQTTKKFKLKMRLWRFLLIWMNPMFSKYRIWLVGSTITGFGTDSSDIDMCLVGGPPHLLAHHLHHYQHNHHPVQQLHPQPYQHSHNMQSEKRSEALMILTLFQSVLKETGIFRDFNLIEARVPILRFEDIINSIEVDLNFNNCVGIMNTYLLQLYAQLDWRTRPLVVVVKLWAQYHDINDAKRMTISSYSLVLMVLHYLQHGCTPHILPCLHTLYPEKFQLGQQDCFDLNLIETIDPYPTQNQQALGELFLGFFKYYSNFDFRNLAISVRTGGVLPVAACRLAKSYKNDAYQWKELNIEEPFDLSNTARSVYDGATFERIKTTFVASARALEHSLDISSVFSPIFGVNVFRNQQQHGSVNGHSHSHSQNNYHGQSRVGSTFAATVAASNKNKNMSPASWWALNHSVIRPVFVCHVVQFGICNQVRTTVQ